MENTTLKWSELTENQLKLFNLLFNYIIPECKSRKIPGAAILLESTETFTEEFMQSLTKTLYLIEMIINNKSERKLYSYSELDIIEEFKRKNTRIFNELILYIITYYYSNQIVLKSIGIQSIPPYPDGNFIIEGDIFLLEQVFLKQRIYR
jgi:hypothetical protein